VMSMLTWFAGRDGSEGLGVGVGVGVSAGLAGFVGDGVALVTSGVAAGVAVPAGGLVQPASARPSNAGTSTALASRRGTGEPWSE
jgi:hypothetical protein